MRANLSVPHPPYGRGTVVGSVTAEGILVDGFLGWDESPGLFGLTSFVGTQTLY